MAKAPNSAAIPSRRLSEEDAAIIKAMLARKIAQHDVAAFMGVHPTVVSDINCGRRFADVEPMDLGSPLAMRRIVEGLAAWTSRISRLLHDAITTAEPPEGRIV